jgi:hypothetical protein
MLFLDRDKADGTGYEYALARPEIRDGDVVAEGGVPLRWGSKEELTADAAFDEDDPVDVELAARFARLLGCSTTVIAPPAPEVKELTSEEIEAVKLAALAAADDARRARVAEHLAAEESKAIAGDAKALAEIEARAEKGDARALAFVEEAAREAEEAARAEAARLEEAREGERLRLVAEEAALEERRSR